MMRSFHETLSSSNIAANVSAASLFEQGQYFLRNNRIASRIFQAREKAPEKTSINNDDESNRIDVLAVTQDVDILLEGKSHGECKQLLTSMISDLLHEVDTLRFRLDQSSKQITRLKEERDVAQRNYQDRLLAILLALQNKIDEPINDIHKEMMNGKINDDGSTTVITADEATMLTIQSLTKKIEKLNIDNSSLQTQISVLNEQIEDFKSDADAKDIKVDALETQFKMINNKRLNMVRKFDDITNSALNVRVNKHTVATNKKKSQSENGNNSAENGSTTYGNEIPILKKPPHVHRVGRLDID